jgi:hypothetical protein
LRKAIACESSFVLNGQPIQKIAVFRDMGKLELRFGNALLHHTLAQMFKTAGF